ncbi:glycogen/starch synthase [Lentimicrobium sp.]|jgi:starch synthase|uniref:glycogen/starch synthase n=1 Tax=Lentimicrobium sp. TaxID=2034841 RepID=UPI0025F36BF5|nr:glycogen/starch synthase [Lentimicrobium sp.]MCO5257483.1 glycogen/starch synthase [Lentimicrobium sp.]MCO5262927.1 glycogen/starch synthase [Lentimicrobium sp.]HOP13541.1 glycogen/starch synthase [Lentimicrobium sp.]HPF65366.1 glycogen/starch synthase [Lentimicrobium sp.]HPJ63001.1 glycogen/starch synthase [Lentimicrobium sp.]
MEKARILFVSQEIIPYLRDSQMGYIGRHLPQGIQERGREIRTFMPRFGHINERRNQLHEVIRLSGMNLIIDDTDHPLIIKVASIQSARMQIYFIDNEDYFQRKFMFRDKNNKFYKDNDERAVFFSRGVIETVKKLGWAPDLIHCHGWMTSLVPLYIKRAYRDNPLFSDTRVVMSIYDDDFEEAWNKDSGNKIKLDGITNKDLKHYKKPTYVNVMKTAIDFSDGVIVGSETVNAELLDYINETGKPMLPYQPLDRFIDAYNIFYDKIMSSQAAASE